MTVPASETPGRARRGEAVSVGSAGSPAWASVLARVALLPPAVCYAVAVVLAGVVAALASGTTPGGEPGLGQALAVGVPLWLVAHLVPLQVTGAPLGVLPLTPALVLGLLIASTARGAVRRLRPDDARGPLHGVLVPVVATAAAAHAVIGVLAAALLTPETVVDASPGLAGVVCGLLGGLAALAGVARPCGLALVPRRLPAWARHGLRGAALAATALLTAGAGLLLAALLADGAAVRAVFADVAPEAGSGAGLALLCVAYLPNAVVAAVAWLAGPGVSIGLAAATPMEISSGLLPPIPLAALLPQSPPPTWAGLAFAVPLAVGSAVGWRLAPTARDAATRVRATVTAAVGAAALLGLAAALSGGRLGAGPFDPVTIPALPVALAVLGWVLVPGLVVALLAVPLGSVGGRARPARPARAAAAPPVHEPESVVGPGAEDTAAVDPDDPDDPDDSDGPDGSDGSDDPEAGAVEPAEALEAAGDAGDDRPARPRASTRSPRRGADTSRARRRGR